jgi:starvation-inducible DNA-binding protein
MTRREIEKAMLAPASVFASPEEVLEDPELSSEQKIEVLLRWEYDAAEGSVAVEEGMPGRDNDLVRRILVALGKLNAAVDVEHTGPGKQHGIALRREGHGADIRSAQGLRGRLSRPDRTAQKGDMLMPRNTELTVQGKRNCAEALSKVLAGTFLRYLKTHNYHWNVDGPQFLALHAKFEEQYRDLWHSIDDIAERIRALGHPAPGTTVKFAELSDIRENPAVPSAAEMLRELVSDHETVASTVRVALSTAQAAGDEATAGLLADRLAYHEKQLWMMRSTTSS